MNSAMREVHDGLVSKLMSTLVALERGVMPADQLLEILRGCVDESRLFVDSQEPLGHDLVVLLATVRHRFAPRLQAAGLQVRWEVEDVPLLPWLEAPQALQVMRLVQQALANVLKHARATSVRIATRLAADEGGAQRVIIEIEDDGVGTGTRVTLALPLTSAPIF